MASMLGTYRDLLSAWRALRGTHAPALREVACAGAPRRLLWAELGDVHQPCVLIAAGLHGDERSGPSALLALVAAGRLDPHFSYRLWPCVNPTGFDAATRESAEGLDINRTFGRGGSSSEARAMLVAMRDRRFVASIDLHEDCDEPGFYAYAYGGEAPGQAALGQAAPGQAALDAVRAHGHPLAETPLLRPDEAEEIAALGGLSLTLAMRRRGVAQALTLEAPGRQNPQARVAAAMAAVQGALAALASEMFG